MLKWNDFYKLYHDEDFANVKYILYLLHFYTTDVIFKKLKTESTNLRYCDDEYIKKLINKYLHNFLYIGIFYPMPLVHEWRLFYLSSSIKETNKYLRNFMR